MFGNLVRRERRTLWGSLTLIIVIAIGGTLYAAVASRAKLTQQAETEAKVAAQTQLARMLQPRDLMGPIGGNRAEMLQASIESEIVSAGPVESIRLYSELGRILYDADPSVVTVKPTYLRDLAYDVAHGETMSEVRNGVLQTYVPLWTSPRGTVVVAEMSQPYGPISAEATGPWYRLALGLGLALLATATLFALSLRTTARVSSITALEAHPAFVAAKDARARAEQRATATEVAFKDLQAQFRKTLDELKAMEAMVEMNENRTTHSEDELQTLRNQLRDSAERLHKAELDNNALRERLALRQTELDDHKTRLIALEQPTPGVEIEELRRRVEIAERRATEMEAEVERIQSELDYTADRFHMVKLTEALREFDNDDVVIDGDDDIYEHPKVVFSTGHSRSTTSGDGR
ncbi:MAG: hypothetical protein ACXWX2_09170 [Actinomycetota bacterium]